MEEHKNFTAIENSPSNTEADFVLWRLLDHTRFMIGRLREKELAEYGLTPEQAHVLDILTQSGGSTTINNIVAVTQRQHNSISTLIDRMSKQGLVSRRRSAEDNRKYEVSITKRGSTLFNRITRDSITASFACLNKEQKRDFSICLKILLGNAYRLHGKKPTLVLPLD